MHVTDTYGCYRYVTSKALAAESHDALREETKILDRISADFEAIGVAADDVVTAFERHAG